MPNNDQESGRPPQQPPAPTVDSVPQQLAEATASDAEPVTQFSRDDPQRTHHSAAPTAAELPPAPPDAAIPERIGKYEVARKLGSGGQASAFLARDPDLQRWVVLKLYPEARGEQRKELVLQEGQALARVESSSVAHCYGAEEHEGTPYLVMQYVPGKNLHQWCQGRPQQPEVSLRIVQQVARGLADVHRRGLIHRDVKPANIIIDQRDQPHLVDFGLAISDARGDAGDVSGTPAYMAPEQARGDLAQVDHRSDLFGAGAVLYQMLTGHAPFEDKSLTGALNKARSGQYPPPTKWNAAIPPRIARLCERCLEPDPANRFQSAEELADACGKLLPGGGGWNLEIKIWKWRVVFSLATAAAMVLLAVMLLPPSSQVAYHDPEVNGEVESVEPVDSPRQPVSGDRPEVPLATPPDTAGAPETAPPTPLVAAEPAAAEPFQPESAQFPPAVEPAMRLREIPQKGELGGPTRAVEVGPSDALPSSFSHSFGGSRGATRGMSRGGYRVPTQQRTLPGIGRYSEYRGRTSANPESGQRAPAFTPELPPDPSAAVAAPELTVRRNGMQLILLAQRDLMVAICGQQEGRVWQWVQPANAAADSPHVLPLRAKVPVSVSLPQAAVGEVVVVAGIARPPGLTGEVQVGLVVQVDPSRARAFWSKVHQFVDDPFNQASRETLPALEMPPVAAPPPPPAP